MGLIEQLDGFLVIGLGPFEVRVKNPNSNNDLPSDNFTYGNLHYAETDENASVLRFMNSIRIKSSAPVAFKYSPEVILSQLKDPFVLNYITRKPFQMFLPHKGELYRSHYPNMIKREKYVGLEKVKDFWYEQYNFLYQQISKEVGIPKRYQWSLTPFQKAIDSCLGSKKRG